VAIYELSVSAALRGQGAIFEATAPLVLKITELLSEPELDQAEVQNALSKFKSLISGDIGLLKRGCQFTYDRLAANFAARTGRQAEALELYDAAVEGVWWYGGPAQKQIIHEALLYAVGIGGKAAVIERYWDKSFLLGINRWPKRALDDQERRRLAMGFEHEFQGKKAQDRVPPRFEVTLQNGPLIISKEMLKNPNRVTKFADGRTRRTPLMQAVQQGTLTDVQRLIAAGGDPNAFIPESGQGPLSIAMYRACNQKDVAIIEFLLSLNLSTEAVNRQFSTQRETPLKLAIEMANPAAVSRLIDLGANFEVDCELRPSALCYALGLFYMSIHTRDRSQEQAYYEGKGGADAYDAKDGAVLDADLAARRQAMVALRNESPDNARIFDSVREYFTPNADELRMVIDVLLRCGANPNRPYRVDGDLVHEWTPTLFAAEIGELKIFQALVEAGGDYERTLSVASSLQRRDALWIAHHYNRTSIMDWLSERLNR
jgi:ankyrin repeat protein